MPTRQRQNNRNELFKREFLESEIHNLFRQYSFPEYENWELIEDYHFGGYAKTSIELFNFIDKIEEEEQLFLDPVYTGKVLYGIMDMIEKDEFEKGSQILFIHTGGLQGRAVLDSSPLILQKPLSVYKSL